MNAKAALLSLSILSLLALPVAALAIAPHAIGTTGSSGRASESADPAAAGGGKIGQAMQVLQSGQQKVGKALDKKDLVTVLAQTIEMQKAVQEAKLDTPPKAGEIKEADKKAEFVAGFRKQMIELQKALLDMEEAAVDGKVDDAKKVFDERVKAAKKDGHSKYKGD